MIPPTAAAMLQGMQQGDQQAQSIIPSSYQPQGRAKATNPWEGTIALIIGQLLQISSEVGGQGENTAKEEKAKLMKITYELQRINNSLTKKAEEGSSNQPTSGAGS